MNDAVIHSVRVMGIIEKDLRSELDDAEIIQFSTPGEYGNGYLDGVRACLMAAEKQIAYTEGLLDNDGKKELARLREND